MFMPGRKDMMLRTRINPEFLAWMLEQLQEFVESGHDHYAGVVFYGEQRMLAEMFIDDVQQQYRMRVFDWNERIEPRLGWHIIIDLDHHGN